MKSIKPRHTLAVLLLLKAVLISPSLPYSLQTLESLDSSRTAVLFFLVFPIFAFWLLLLASSVGFFWAKNWAPWCVIAAAIPGFLATASSVVPFFGHLLIHMSVNPIVAVGAVNLVVIAIGFYLRERWRHEDQV